MENKDLKQLQYPVGGYDWPESASAEQIQEWLQTIADFPAAVLKIVEESTAAQREWPYRPGGWNIRQLVHHTADSHLNSLVRFKWALSEDCPTIKAYDQNGWAAQSDYTNTDLTLSLNFLVALHARWVDLMRSLNAEELQRKYNHPDHDELRTLAGTIGGYAWHCRHHLAHMRLAISSNGDYQ